MLLRLSEIYYNMEFLYRLNYKIIVVHIYLKCLIDYIFLLYLSCVSITVFLFVPAFVFVNQ